MTILKIRSNLSMALVQGDQKSIIARELRMITLHPRFNAARLSLLLREMHASFRSSQILHVSS